VPERETTLRRPDGTTVPALVTARFVRDDAGGLESAVVVLRPGRPRGRHTPSGIEVISTVSHELRSPLTSVKGYTSLLLNRWERLGDEQKKMMLTQVHHDADRVTRLVTELLDISRLETGRLHLRRQQVDLVALAGSVVAKLALEYPDLECALDFPADFPAVYADPDKVEQVLTNLVENAAKYASPTGMRLTGVVGDDVVEVSVHDRGEGIPSSDLPRVFSKFFRRDHGKPTGSGLGLWISRGLVEAHGGRLTAASIEAQGSVFTFTLPTDAFEKLHDA
jgi:signal transduction histidine kinase